MAQLFICNKCKEPKSENQYCVYTAIIKTGKEKRRRKICKDCNYHPTRYKRKFSWTYSSNKEKIKQLKSNFEKYVIKKDGCWDWKGYIRPDGYTRIRIGCRRGIIKQQSIGAHVVSWMIHHKYLKFDNFKKDQFYILHKCDNRKCTNPKHLFKGDCKANMIDMINKNRGVNKLTYKQVRSIKIKINIGVSLTKLALKYKVSRSTIGDIKNNITWKHVTIDDNQE